MPRIEASFTAPGALPGGDSEANKPSAVGLRSERGYASSGYPAKRRSKRMTGVEQTNWPKWGGDFGLSKGIEKYSMLGLDTSSFT